MDKKDGLDLSFFSQQCLVTVYYIHTFFLKVPYAGHQLVRLDPHSFIHRERLLHWHKAGHVLDHYGGAPSRVQGTSQGPLSDYWGEGDWEGWQVNQF